MILRELFRMGMQAILANKVRGFLTALGIIIGVAAVIAMLSLGEGAQKAIQDRIQAMGTDVYTVSPGWRRHSGVSRSSNRLVIDDAEAIAAQCSTVLAVSAGMSMNSQVEFSGRNTSTNVLATTPEAVQVDRYAVSHGRFIDARDQASRSRVAVVGTVVLENLETAPENLLGRDIILRDLRFEVVGVLESKGQQGWRNPDDQVIIPLSTGQYRVFGTDKLRTISCQVVPGTSEIAAMMDIEKVLRRQHHLRPDQDNDFMIRNWSEMLSTFEETQKAFNFLLAGIAAISLLVGGIGIMNIMLVSVTERTREIGIRKALGATRANVMAQFLVESMALCLAGGLAGVLLGVGGSFALSRLAGWNTLVNLQAVALAFLFSAAVGLFFGLYPAARASRLDPIEALRHE
ncbi:MAG: ABC transporter permease [Candidatus Krumholzibacteria bacterium]|nr:ABC transporter permease [Candidatus Krumholzibacteria bacterium]MDP6668835.1 ABC transporter permease [Candidatus Krumholzibacteria bacterium]MDP7022020.1 ABC transporter permease [Candidatus Krumholzibacteria bacterium]